MLGLIRFAEWLKLNRSNFKDLAYFTSIMALIIDFILEVFAEKNSHVMTFIVLDNEADIFLL